jgi:hypothetical protein
MAMAVLHLHTSQHITAHILRMPHAVRSLALHHRQLSPCRFEIPAKVEIRAIGLRM